MASAHCYGCDNGINLRDGALECPLCGSTFVELSETPAFPRPPPSLSGLLARMLSHDGDTDYAPAPAEPDPDPAERELARTETRATGRAANGSSGVPITNLAQYLSDSFSTNNQPEHARYPANNPYDEADHHAAPPRTRSRSLDAPLHEDRLNLDQQQNEIPGTSPLAFLYTLFFGSSNPQAIGANVGDYAWGANGFDRILNDLMVQAQQGPGPNACSDQVIASLPRIEMTQELIQKSSVADCSICREEFAVTERLIKLPCPHYFHGDCIEPWLKSSGTCPVCRHAVVPQPGDEPIPILDAAPSYSRSRSRTPSASMSRSSSSLPGSFPGSPNHGLSEEEELD